MGLGMIFDAMKYYGGGSWYSLGRINTRKNRLGDLDRRHWVDSAEAWVHARRFPKISNPMDEPL